MAGKPTITPRPGGTIRQQITSLLQDGPMDRRELSQALGIREKEVADHLEHVAKSAGARRLKWVIHSAYCESCDFRFSKRKRLSRPGRCPRCRGERIQGPWFELIDK